MVKSTHKLPLDLDANENYLTPIGKNLLVLHSIEDDGLQLLHIPPIASRKPIDVWNIHPPPLFFDLAVYHPENFLAVTECN